MNKHEELVRSMAEEMAQVGFDHFSPSLNTTIWIALDDAGKEARIDHFIPYACIAAKHMAAAASLFLGSLSEYGVKKRLMEHGFIPDDTVTRKAE